MRRIPCISTVHIAVALYICAVLVMIPMVNTVFAMDNDNVGPISTTSLMRVDENMGTRVHLEVSQRNSYIYNHKRKQYQPVKYNSTFLRRPDRWKYGRRARFKIYRPGRSLVDRPNSLTLGQLHHLASRLCSCGVRPLREISTQVCKN